MDKDTRNAIERATQRARKLLEEDFAAQLEGDFDVLRDGAVAVKAGGHLSARQAFQRERIVAAVEHKRAAAMNAADSVADYLRDAAFTTLNRFVALKMLEARELVQECITKGEQSAGYREFCGMAPGLPLLPESAGYRLYIESLFDELSTEVKVLFDRRDPSSALWPKRATFEQLLEILNATELTRVWGEDETIGWVYQFFNSKEERAAMRDVKQGGSQAPRNSRELAVRNQFFTPRYVVQFLTDNTLGRIWYEMRGAKTVLADRCEYRVRKPGEEFAPRAKKDPRDLRVLDPACGSGHFLLYAFDLLVAIYEEAYADPESPRSEATGKTLAEDYPSFDALQKAVPSLVVAYNLHGVDIDPRCAQIAQLALWMRAQKAYRDFGISRAERAQIRRSNIVVAEPLVADEQIAKEFVAKLGDADLERVFTALVEALNLAGDLGLLLRIEQLVGRQVKRGHTGDLFAPTETRIRSALAGFVGEEGGRTNTRRRLFAEDAAHGVGLLSVSEMNFDVVLMNPPFGEPSQRSKPYLYAEYPLARGEILANFVERALSLLHPSGMLGAITSRTVFFLGSLSDFRRDKLYGDAHLELVADLGDGVLDATVETAAYCISRASKSDSALLVVRALLAGDKAETLRKCARASLTSASNECVFYCRPRQFLRLGAAPLAYWIPPATLERLARLPCLDPAAASVLVGLQTGDDFRFLRNWWEVPPSTIAAGLVSLDNARNAGALKSAYETAFRGPHRWAYFSKTDTAEPWLSPIHLVVNWTSQGREIRSLVDKDGAPRSRLRMLPVGKHPDGYFLRGYSYMLRSTRLVPYIVPPGVIPTAGRSQVYPTADDDIEVLALLASNVGSGVARLSGEKFAWPKFQKSMVQSIPFAEFSGTLRRKLREFFDSAIDVRARRHSSDETGLFFVGPELHASALADQEELSLQSLLGRSLEMDVAAALGLESTDLQAIESDIRDALSVRKVLGDSVDDEPEESEQLAQPMKFTALHDRVSYFVGVLFGRWDLKVGARRDRMAALADPFAPLPCAPPGALVGPDALPVVRVGVNPAEARLDEFPADICRDGISHDDDGDSRDLVKRIAGYLLEVSGADAATLTDQELRVWIRTHFFEEHVRRYTRGRRKSPIYWQLATPSSRYSVWIYIHAFSKDTIFRVQKDYATPKLAHEQRRLEHMIDEHGEKATAAQRKDIAAHEAFVEELRVFLEELKRVAPLWKPNLDDGVIINFAPLWRLVPQNKPWQKELKSTWDALCEGKYDWAHLAMHLWPERVVPKCAKDRSLAIAHGLEDVFWVGNDGKWTARKTPTRSIDELVREGTSPAVKSALKSLLEAPTATGSGGRSRAARRRARVGAEAAS